MPDDNVAQIKSEFIISPNMPDCDGVQERRDGSVPLPLDEANSSPTGVKSQITDASNVISDLPGQYESIRLMTNTPNAPCLEPEGQLQSSGSQCMKLPEGEAGDTKPRGGSRMNIKGKLYLGPLSKVGTLPFRRICAEFGADITCTEMVKASELLKGNPFEWALVSRHPSEKFFGVQLCGASPEEMTKAAQLVLSKTHVDFLDINAACPRNPVCKMGAGCALMNDTNRLGEIVSGMRSVMNDSPLTIKFRKGMEVSKDIAHEVLEVVKHFDVDLVTVHGRSKDQPDTEISDWAYVGQCAKAIYPLPLVGVGDVLSYVDYYHNLDAYPVETVMIARGALIKPWLFTEIREKRHWDISGSERLEILKRFVSYGLEHWGADQAGVTRTRYSLLEWLSFLYRYVPAGVLEYLPQRMVHRFPRYFGRNDLETLMASDRSEDWIKMSEMLLGPVPSDFQFVPKHKTHCYL